MKRVTLFTMGLMFQLAVNAFCQDIRYNYDKDADFSKFKTYKWVEIKGATQANDIVDKDIKRAVDSQLATKGLTKADDNPDLLIGYQVGLGTEKQFTSYNTDWGYGPGWYRGGWYGSTGGMTTGQTSTIYNGTLDLDMYEPSKKELVWRGTASKTVDPGAKPEKQQKNLNKAVAKLLKKYPPEAKK
jgi:Domain of unknown function (DUF4136)